MKNLRQRFMRLLFILNNSLLGCLIFLYIASLIVCLVQASQVVLVVKNSPGNAGHIRVAGLIPGSGRPPGQGNGNPLQYSSWDNPIDREAWWAKSMGSQKVGDN